MTDASRSADGSHRGRTVAIFAVVAVLIALVLWWSFGRHGSNVGPAARSVAPTVAPAPPLATLDDVADDEQRAVIEDDAEALPPARMLRDDDPMALLRIRVVDAVDHRPVAGAIVWFWACETDPELGPRSANAGKPIDSSLTGADGLAMHMYEPGIFPRGTISSSTFRPVTYQTKALARGEERDLVVEVVTAPDGILCGRVIASDTRKPVANASVEYRTSGGTGSAEKIAPIAISEDGRFHVEWRVWRDQGLEVRAPGYGPRWVAVGPGHETDATAVEIALDRGASLRLTVLDASDSPVRNLQIVLEAENVELSPSTSSEGKWLGRSSWWSSKTAEGLAEWTDLPAGLVLGAEARRIGRLLHRESGGIVLSAGELREATWKLAPTSEVRGVVLENGMPVAGQVVWMQPSKSGGDGTVNWIGDDLRQATSDADGRFHFADLRPGPWSLAPHAAIGREDPERDPLPLVQTVEVPAEATSIPVEVRLQRGLVIRGRVLAPDGVTPVSTRVRAKRKGSTPLMGASKKDASFVLGPLLPGPWQVKALSSDSYCPSEELLVDAGATDVGLVLRRAVDLRVRVIDGEGAPVQDVEVHVSQRGLASTSASTDAFGIARIGPWFPPGVGAAGCTLPDGRWGFVPDVRMSFDPLEVELRLQAGVRARIRYEGSVLRRTVEIRRDDMLLGVAWLTRGRTCDVTLPVGRVTLRADGGDLGKIEHELVVNEGSAPELTFDGAWK